MIRKQSLANGMFLTKFSLAKGIRSKTGAAHPRQKFFRAPHSHMSMSTMHHAKQKCAHFCSEWCIVVYETGALWDL